MKLLVIGSQAIKHHYPDFPRKPKDNDAFYNNKVEGFETFWHPLLEKYVKEKEGWQFATPNELYTIKVSHAFWDLHGTWEKHMHDMMYLKDKGATLIPELYQILYQIWQEVHGKKKAKLNVEAKDFFKKTVKRVYEHDSIHASIAYYKEPLFNKILKDGQQVAVSEEKFNQLPEVDKAKLVREEVYATALERILIPENYKHSPRHAYHLSLKNLITSYSKGWFPLWVVDNYKMLYKPDVDYVQLHISNKRKLIKIGE